MIILFAGSIGRFPAGGHAWINMQYLLGLQQLGHDVYYVEECGEGSWVYDWKAEKLTTDLNYPTRYLRSCLDDIGFSDRWIYRAGDQSVGMPLHRFIRICSSADLLIARAVSINRWRDEYLRPKRRAFVDADPAFTQFRLANGDKELKETVFRCDTLFTIGQRFGKSDCPVPTLGRLWYRTLPPVSLDHWPVSKNHGRAFTSIMQWRSYDEVSYDSKKFKNKNVEFQKFIHVPEHTAQRFTIAITGYPTQELRKFGWNAITGWSTVYTPKAYQMFIQGSRAEFGVAKHGYVETRGGWFSDRSVCYLASGKPVLIQDTGLRDWIPIGDGILSFRSLEDVLRGVENINENYEHHCLAARSLAESYFDARRVLPRLIETATN